MYDHRLWQSMNKPGKVANPARGQLNKKKVFPPVSVVFAKRQTPRLHISVLLHCYTIKRQYLTWNRKSQSMMNPLLVPTTSQVLSVPNEIAVRNPSSG